MMWHFIFMARISGRRQLPRVAGALLLLFLIGKDLRAQDSIGSPHYFFTTADFRQKFHDALIQWSINRNLAASLDQPDGQYDFKSAFWPMELIGYRSAFARERLTYAFTQLDRCSPAFQRGLLEAVYTLWPDSFTTQVARLMHQTRAPKIFAMCAEYLWRGGKKKDYTDAIVALLKQRFQNQRQDPILLMLTERLNQDRKSVV